MKKNDSAEFWEQYDIYFKYLDVDGFTKSGCSWVNVTADEKGVSHELAEKKFMEEYSKANPEHSFVRITKTVYI